MEKESAQRITCVLIDDEPHVLERFSDLVSQIPQFILVGTYPDIPSAVTVLKQQGGVDIIFSDIQMPDLDGIAGGKLLKQHARLLVYITGYRKHALDAYEVGADEYLLKPLTYTTFMERMGNLIEKHGLANKPGNMLNRNGGETPREWIFIKDTTANDMIKLTLKDVIYVTSLGNYCIFHTAERNHTHYKSLKEVQKALQGNGFFRINKTTVIAMAHVDRVNGNMVYLSGITEGFLIGETYRKQFLPSLQW